MVEDLTLTRAISLTDDAVLRDPFPAYKWLRDNAPVYKDPVSGFYIVTRYADIEAIAGDPATFSNNTQMYFDRAFLADDEAGRVLREEAIHQTDTILTADPPAHTKYRAIVQGAFHPRRINKMGEYITALSDELITGFEDKGRFEVLGDLAIVLPMYIIADQLGVPREDYETFKYWSDSRLLFTDLRLPVEVRVKCAWATVEMQKYLLAIAERYRAEPADNIFSDVVNGEIDGRKLNDAEIISIVSQLIVAGNETTTNTIAMGLQWMCRNGIEPALRADPSLMPVFVEEVLRLCSALQGMYRRTTRDTSVGGVDIPAGSVVMLRWGAANRDERKFDNPDAMQLDRKNANQHLAFGSGIHYCVGNALARAELRIAFTSLLARLKNFRIADEPDNEQWVVHAFARGISRLVLEFDRV